MMMGTTGEARSRRALAVTAFAAMAAIGFAAAPARADVIYDTFLPGNTYDNVFLSVLSGQPAAEYELASSFDVGAGQYALTSIDFALLAVLGGGTTIQVSIYDDSAGAPGQLIESSAPAQVDAIWDPVTALLTEGDPFMTVNFSGNTLLSAGQSYWVGVSESDGTAVGWFNSGGVSPTVVANYRLVGGDWISFQFGKLAMRVNGAAVPVPAGLWALGVGVIGLGSRRRRASAD